MPKIELGPVGAVLSPAAKNVVEASVELERLGVSTIWLPGGPLASLDQIAEVVRATNTAKVASGIIPVVRFDAPSVAALYADLEADHPGRFVVGLGGAHNAKPIQTLNAYLDALDAASPPVPAARRVLAALGPKMLQLARDRAAGALPVLVTPGYTSGARAILGDDTTLAVEQLVVLERDAERARAIARGPLGFLSQVPAYPANFRRMGLVDDDISALSDRFVDALVGWGDAQAIAARVAAQREAGADHVAVSVVSDVEDLVPVDQWTEIAAALVR